MNDLLVAELDKFRFVEKITILPFSLPLLHMIQFSRPLWSTTEKDGMLVHVPTCKAYTLMTDYWLIAVVRACPGKVVIVKPAIKIIG